MGFLKITGLPSPYANLEQMSVRELPEDINRNPVENAGYNAMKGQEELQAHNVSINDTVIGIAASGSAPYVINALHRARQNRILTDPICSNSNAHISGEAGIAVEMIAARKFYGSVKKALYAL